jgi:hypothetical protein
MIVQSDGAGKGQTLSALLLVNLHAPALPKSSVGGESELYFAPHVLRICPMVSSSSSGGVKVWKAPRTHGRANLGPWAGSLFRPSARVARLVMLGAWSVRHRFLVAAVASRLRLLALGQVYR